MTEPSPLAHFTTGQLIEELSNRTSQMIIVTVFQSEDGQMINHDFNCTWSEAIGLCKYLELRLNWLITKYQIEGRRDPDDPEDDEWWKRT